MQRLIGLWLAFVLCVCGAAAQELSPLARLDPAASSISPGAPGVEVRLALSQSVPWRVRVLDAPPRVVLDVREVDWRGIDRISRTTPEVVGLRAGVFRPGWSRLVLELDSPHLVGEAAMRTGKAGVEIALRLDPAMTSDDRDAFARAAAEREPPEWAPPALADLPPPAARGDGPVVIVIDPGHGGIDPGAERDGQTEANLVLTFAREFKELLSRSGRFRVVLTRDDDVFVPLETRVSVARASGAHLFLSLHADALAEGEAVGATLYSLDDRASDEASRALAERHSRDDLLSGVDLNGQDDLVAQVLMDMARTETMPRTERLAGQLEAAIKGAGLKMHRQAHQKAGFSVLKSPDIPSLLVELGFLSSAEDLARLSDPDWRARMAKALMAGVIAWADEDAALAALRD